MKRKVNELDGALLDAAVAKAVGFGGGIRDGVMLVVRVAEVTPFAPSTDWGDGGPIIERERIVCVPFIAAADISYNAESNHDWQAMLPKARWGAWCGVAALSWFECEPEHGYLEDPIEDRAHATGPTPLVAAMRAYVARKFGEEIELP